MKYIHIILLVLLSGALSGQHTTQPILLPNGWQISPAGTAVPLGDLPLNIAISSKGSYMAVVNCGQSVQSIQLFSPSTLQQFDSVIIERTWYGLAFSRDEKRLYVSGGNNNTILQYNIIKNKLVKTDSIVLGRKWPYKISPAGLTVDDEANTLYVVTKENNTLYTVDLLTKKIKDSVPIGGEGYTCVLSPDRKELYVSCWGCDQVKVFNTISRKFTDSIAVGDNPNELLLSPNGKYLFVCNANDNSVSVISTSTRKVIETLNAALYPASPPGSTTNGIALNKNGTLLYIANASNNNLCVFDVSKPGKSFSKGFIPVGWYPTNVKCFKNKIFVTNGKGFSSLANPHGPNPFGNRQKVMHHGWEAQLPVQYIGGLFKGTLSSIEMPTGEDLRKYTAEVYRNSPYSKAREEKADVPVNNPVPATAVGKSPIKYVFYVIKENRTYDQVLSDIAGGNGDTSLLLFGEKITPNQHKLARDFVLLDNFYVDAEVSADGHNWTMGAYATDYLEKTWPTNYGGRGGSYDAEGNRSIANNKGGFLWDQCKRFGVSYRSYGEFADNYKPNIPSLNGRICNYFTGYNTSIKDTVRFFQWKRDFDSLVHLNVVPQFNTVRFGNDHTDGLRLGRPTPYAHVADNDLAVGLFIEHLSRSPIWNETAVFILEDDAQNGADHVDAHRSTAYVAGGFVKRGFVDHTMYSTTSMLRTMELILGIPPMTQYDAAATPMWRCFDTVSRPYTFNAIIPEVNLNEKNIAKNEWQRISETFDISKEDSNPDIEFNRVLWHAIKGDKPFPPIRRSAFVLPESSGIK